VATRANGAVRVGRRRRRRGTMAPRSSTGSCRRTAVASPTSPSGAEVPPVLPSIPLAPEGPRSDDQSIGALVHEVTTHLSTLVRSEVELAKSEVTAEIRKGVTGSVFFAVAAVIGLFSLFFFFFTIAELLGLWLVRWAAFAVTFG